MIMRLKNLVSCFYASFKTQCIYQSRFIRELTLLFLSFIFPRRFIVFVSSPHSFFCYSVTDVLVSASTSYACFWNFNLFPFVSSNPSHILVCHDPPPSTHRYWLPADLLLQILAYVFYPTCSLFHRKHPNFQKLISPLDCITVFYCKPGRFFSLRAYSPPNPLLHLPIRPSLLALQLQRAQRRQSSRGLESAPANLRRL